MSPLRAQFTWFIQGYQNFSPLGLLLQCWVTTNYLFYIIKCEIKHYWFGVKSHLGLGILPKFLTARLVYCNMTKTVLEYHF